MNEKTRLGFDHIIDKVMMINDITKHEVFIFYYGHVGCLDIRVYKDGWYENKTPDIDFVYDNHTTDSEFGKFCDMLNELLECDI